MESRQDMSWNYFRIIDYILQLIIFILNIIRYILFINVRSFVKNNKNIYDKNQYYPESINADSFPLAISISIIFYFLLFLITKNKRSCQSKDFRQTKYYFFNDESQKKFRIFMIILPFFIIYFYIFINDIINYYKVKKIYNHTIYNWALNPITSIGLSPKNDYELELGHLYLSHLYLRPSNDDLKKDAYYFYSWENKFFTIKKHNNYNYMNIYSNKDGKLCGKDSFGNNLFFPQNEECPINHIYIDNQNHNNGSYNYTNIYLGESKYLHYTNEYIEGNILIDLKAGSPLKIMQLNYEKTNDICEKLKNESFNIDCKKFYEFNTIIFYKEIDNGDFYDFLEQGISKEDIKNRRCDYETKYTTGSLGNITLFSLTYQGINSTKVINREKVKKYIKYIRQ
jgi:hypothetical protein